MKLAVVSDLHLGDPMCSLIVQSAPGTYVPGPKLPYLLKQLGGDLDYLVLAGDVFDLSIASYQEAYTAARTFFAEIANNQVAREIIYVPGNHDFAAWHILMHEINVIRRLKVGKPIETRYACPGVIDDRPNGTSRGRLELPYVSRNPDGRYGGVYLQALMPNPAITINVAYPNLYVVDANGVMTLITHGQYLDTFWALTGEFAKEVVGPDLRFAGGQFMDIDDFVGINFPLGELTSSGLGQAGALTAVIRAVQRDYKDGRFDRIDRYLGGARNYVDNHYLKYGGLKEILTDKGLDLLKGWVLDRIKASNPARYDDQFAEKGETQERFRRYYIASMLETQKIAPLVQMQSAVIANVIFGHTHEYIGWDSGRAPAYFIEAAQRTVRLANMGGWLSRPGRPPGDAVGGGVFAYSTEKGFSSTVDTPARPIAYADNEYRGRSQELDVGRYARLSEIGNDVISSVRVPPGYRVTLFEHTDFRGANRVLVADTPALPSFNDMTSSAIVERTATA